MTVTARSTQMLWVVPRKFGARARMGIRESGAPLKTMVECIPMTCSFLLQSCCLATNSPKLN